MEGAGEYPELTWLPRMHNNYSSHPKVLGESLDKLSNGIAKIYG